MALPTSTPRRVTLGWILGVVAFGCAGTPRTDVPTPYESAVAIDREPVALYATAAAIPAADECDSAIATWSRLKSRSNGTNGQVFGTASTDQRRFVAAQSRVERLGCSIK